MAEDTKEKMPTAEIIVVKDGDTPDGLRTRTVIVRGASPKFRDTGKVFLITEKPAMQAELFAVRVLKLLISSGVDIGGNALALGMKGLAVQGSQGRGTLPLDEVEAIFKEMLACVSVIPDPQRLPDMARPLVDNDIRQIVI